MALSTEQWHHRYSEQSRWTASLRNFVFQQIDFSNAGTVLEVGCGTGAVLSSLPACSGQLRFGLDISLEPLLFAQKCVVDGALVCADGGRLPFPDGSLDICFCHYLLLWLTDPLPALREMRRVTRTGGYIAALAEPDYASRIDFPPAVSELGNLQNTSLEEQGVNITVGRQLPGIFSAAGLHEIQYGVSGFQKDAGGLPDWFSSEWQTIRHDLKDVQDEAVLEHYQSLDEKAWREGSRVLWVPTFYAFGRV
jgi:ubiquinone/menaquinone biosynthesis C-methylase UbiE